MKSLINLSIFALFIALTAESFGQTFGIKAGYNLSNMIFEKSEFGIPYQTTSYNNNLKMKSGFNVGASLEYPVLKWLTLETGILFNTKGYKNYYEDDTWDTTITVNESFDLYYLDIPLNAKIPFSIKGLNFYGSLGGYAGMGLFGNSQTKSTFGSLSESQNENIEWGSEAGKSDF